MIHDLADLEPLLRQYHPEKVLVGPLLNLWTNSSFRVFKIAGSGGKIYETVGLGFVKVEADAQLRRADIVAVLESRFGEVQTFDSQLEMAQAAHTLWANDETAGFLATATAESRLRPTAKVDQDQSLDAATKSSVLPSDRDRELVDEAARGSVALDAMSAHAQPSARDQTQPTLDLPIHANLPLDRDSFTFAAVGLESSTETSASTGTIAATDANAETISETETNTETAAETVANTETIADANTFRARSAKPKRRPRTPRRGSAAGAGGAAAAVANTETIAETEANTETAAETANTQPVFEHSDQPPVEKQSQSEPASGGARAFGDDYASRQRGLRPNPVLTPLADVLKWSILKRIGIPLIVVSAVACVIGPLFSYEESLHDSVLHPPSSLASRGGALPSVKSTKIESAMVDDGPVAAAYSLRPASPSEKPTESQRPPRSTFIPPDQSALKAEVTGGSAMNQPMQPIPPASDTSPATNAAPISVAQSATPAPNDPAVQLDNDEMTRLIKRGKDFLAQGNFASARLLFKRAADAGSAEAALALGSTYDPSVIKQLGAVSITPDIDGALKWYETAADHGSAEAAGLFANLMRLRKAAMAAKPTAAKPRSETEPVEEKANSRTITEPEVPPSTQPLATPGPVPKKEPTAIGGKAESQATGQPSETSDPVPKKEPTTIAGRTEGSASGQPAEMSDPVLNKATTAIGGKAESQATGQPSETSDPVPKKEPTTIAGRTEGSASGQPAEMSDPVLNKATTAIGGKAESQATGQPSETSDPVPKKEPTTIAGRTEGSASGQPAETSDPVSSEISDPVLKKAKIVVAAKMEDPTYAEFVDMKRVMRKNSFGEPFEIICGHVKGKMKSGEATGERPFLYLVKENEAFIVGGNPASMAAIVYRAQCVSANSR